jgi:hypothetical protein
MSSVPVGSDSDVARAAHTESAKDTQETGNSDRGHAPICSSNALLDDHQPAIVGSSCTQTRRVSLSCWAAAARVAGSTGLLVAGASRAEEEGAICRGCLSKY